MDVSKLSIAEINSLAAKLSKRKEKLEKGQIEKVRAKVTALLRKEGLTLQDLVKGGSTAAAAPRPAKKARGAGKGKGGGAGRKVAPKYRNPNNAQETWTGRGINPRWMTELLAQGMTKEQMLIPAGG
jgi:DNA-binding protein H-NS